MVARGLVEESVRTAREQARPVADTCWLQFDAGRTEAGVVGPMGAPRGRASCPAFAAFVFSRNLCTV